jgi:hypothetical protein
MNFIRFWKKFFLILLQEVEKNFTFSPIPLPFDKKAFQDRISPPQIIIRNAKIRENGEAPVACTPGKGFQGPI